MAIQTQPVPPEMQQVGEWLTWGLGALLAGVALGWWVKNK